MPRSRRLFTSRPLSHDIRRCHFSLTDIDIDFSGCRRTMMRTSIPCLEHGFRPTPAPLPPRDITLTRHSRFNAAPRMTRFFFRLPFSTCLILPLLFVHAEILFSWPALSIYWSAFLDDAWLSSRHGQAVPASLGDYYYYIRLFSAIVLHWPAFRNIGAMPLMAGADRRQCAERWARVKMMMEERRPCRAVT